MYDFEIAYYFYRMAKIQEIFEESKYKAKAYFSAAIAIDSYEEYITEKYKEGTLREIPFIGKSIEKAIVEIIETGCFKQLKDAEKKYDIKDSSILLYHGLSSTLIKKINDGINNGINIIENPKCVNKEWFSFTKGELKKLEAYLIQYEKNKGKYLVSYGLCLGSEIVEFLKKRLDVHMAFIEGELTSSAETISNIEIGVKCSCNWNTLAKYFRSSSRYMDVKKYQDTIIGKTVFGIPFIVRDAMVEHVVPKDELLPQIKGDLHAHTLWSDGIHSIEDMARRAEKLGYEYFAITDHSVSMRVAHGLSEAQALSQIQEIRDFNKNSFGFKLLAGIEVDILSDGSLDYSDETLSQFDFVVAAIHSHLEQKDTILIKRLERALANPYVDILAHPTGRLLGRPGVFFSSRKSIDIDISTLIEICRKNYVAMEINCFPERLDLSHDYAKMAINAGVMLSLGTDSHSLAHISNIKYGTKLISDIPHSYVLNTYSYSQLLELFRNRRQKKSGSYIGLYEKVTSFKNIKKDFNHYFGNNSIICSGKKSILGIDLTGSEQKESGWAYLKANNVICKRILTDKEIIESAKQYKPDIISIDSPLAYPRGRCCTRKDCNCSKYGIMRESEKQLRHYGIPVYPCLIDSMVNLTTRGMHLAESLRELGFKVIESYPGVAQDILEIPRKGKTKEQFQHLKQGIISFGICGDIINNNMISHDEVDAITSALVGYFYLNGQYVGLGNDDEDYLIVPRIQSELLEKRIIIGLCGPTGAGKTTISDYLRFKYGFQSMRYSKVIEELYHIHGKEELQKIGAMIAKDSEKQQGLTKYMLQKIDTKYSCVIDGLRHMEDYYSLRDAFGEDFVFVFIDSSYKKRLARYTRLHHNDISEEMFAEMEMNEAEKDIVLLGYYKQYLVDNNQSFKKLWPQIDEIILEYCKGR